MAKIEGFSPTPEVEGELSKLLVIRTKRRTNQGWASQHPKLHIPPARPVRWPDAFDMEWVGRWFAEHQIYGFRTSDKASYAAAIKAAIYNRDWSDRRFLVPTPFRDQIETCEPTHVRDMQRAINPYDPAEIKPTWCSYRNTVVVSDYDPNSSATHPGWIGDADSEGWFRDTVFRQRALYFDLSDGRSDGQQTPVLIHLTGRIEVLAQQAGAITWFAPAVSAVYGPANPDMHPTPKPMPYAYRALVQRDLTLPPREWSWYHEVEFEWVFNLTALRKTSFRRNVPTMRLNLAAMPSFGRYHAQNAWAEGTAWLNASVIVCRR